MSGRTRYLLCVLLFALLLSACARSLGRSPAAVGHSPATVETARVSASSGPAATLPAILGTALPTPATTQVIPTPMVATEAPGGPYITVPAEGEAEAVNLRGGPGPSFPIIGKLSKGDTAPAVGRIGPDWIMIRYAQGPEGTAWVYAHLVVLSGDVPDLKTPAAPEN